jgi:16S rRNA (uracil1498-N3)-methyltransferase
MSQRFYVNCPLGPGIVSIHGPEAHHLAGVCRVRPGQQVFLFNGDGKEYPALVRTVQRGCVELEIQGVEAPDRELRLFLEVAVPLPRGDRAQFLVEKLTELGVSRLVLLRTARSVVAPREGKREKLERWVIEASKQCGRNVLMEIAPLTDWSSYCTAPSLPAIRWFAHPGMEHFADKSGSAGGGAAVAVGPEGGFTDEEVGLAVTAGWQPVSLGPRILRVETAALVLAAVLALGEGQYPASRERERPE